MDKVEPLERRIEGRKTPAAARVAELRDGEFSLAREAAANRELRTTYLKSLGERGEAQHLVQGQYWGRYPFELMQNANDAAAQLARRRGRKYGQGRVLFRITPTALLVADNGTGFSKDNVSAIASLGKSSKTMSSSVGYKGLGFKSVGEVTATPQVVSEGCAFSFDESRVRSELTDILGALPQDQLVPSYAFPFDLLASDLGADAGLVAQLREQFTTVIRLPFTKDGDRERVAGQLDELVRPDLLTFLDGLEELEVVGTPESFRATATRKVSGVALKVDLVRDGAATTRLVYRRRIPVSAELVIALGKRWADLREVEVGVAVPLVDGGDLDLSPQPIHVYFPTLEDTGLPVVVQGDFALELDRKRLSMSHEANEYNSYLARAAAELLAEVVGPDLANRFPTRAVAVQALVPRGPSSTSTVSGVLRTHLDSLLPAVKFVPRFDGSPSTPREAWVVPESLPDPKLLRRHYDRHACGELAVEGVQEDRAVAEYLASKLGTPALSEAQMIRKLAPPPGPKLRRAYYSLLVAWADRSMAAVSAALAEADCVLTTGGTWVAPSSGVCFPRRRRTVRLPKSLDVPVAQVPRIDGLEELLRRAGVHDFEWREVIASHIVPLLEDDGTSAKLRRDALKALRTYFSQERIRDPRVKEALGRVRLLARSADGVSPQLEPAAAIYFSHRWTHDDRLEQLYGPFGRAEFLAEAVPKDSDAADEDRRFYAWLGVAERPRVDAAVADTESRYRTGNVSRHPHRKPSGRVWSDWWESDAVRSARRCPAGHPESQQLTESYVLDRFHEVVDCGDEAQLVALWQLVADGWGGDYQPAISATFRCVHGACHLPARSCWSLLGFALQNEPWVPTMRGDDAEPTTPSQAWLAAGHLRPPKAMQSELRLLHPALSRPVDRVLAASLGVSDSSSPSPAAVVGLIQRLGLDTTSTALTGDRLTQARWIMRALGEALLMGELPESQVQQTPLLSCRKGVHSFRPRPYTCSSQDLADVWQSRVPVLEADSSSVRVLESTFNLVRLDGPESGHSETPSFEPVRGDQQLLISRDVDRAKGYLLALVAHTAPGRLPDALRALRRLELQACSDLRITYSFERYVIRDRRRDAFLAERLEPGKTGGLRRVGTAYVTVGVGERPNWFAAGPLIARHAEVPLLGDAFSILLDANEAGRRRFLQSRDVPLRRVEELREELGQTDDDDGVWGPHGPGTPVVSAGTQAETPPTPATLHGGKRRDHAEKEALPELDEDRITGAVGRPAPVTTKKPSNKPGKRRPTDVGPDDPADRDARAREHGERGEEAAFRYETRRRAQEGPPGSPKWVSKDDPLSPYDIRSEDEHGDPIYIEVKSTSGSDPYAAFPISSGELACAAAQGPRYRIYRVTDVKTAAPKVTVFTDPVRLLEEERATLSSIDLALAFGRPKR